MVVDEQLREEGKALGHREAESHWPMQADGVVSEAEVCRLRYRVRLQCSQIVKVIVETFK